MIVLDTHIWVWWVTNSPKLTIPIQRAITKHQHSGLGLSVFSCWEVAKLVEKQRLEISQPVNDWLNTALKYPGIKLLDLTVPIAVESTKLENFHSDPADQIIVATAKVHECPLLTVDRNIVAHNQIQTIDVES
ncbi:MAG: type II toxin-antitoxin system VapC family toxin [Cyanobacteria bacterium J06649_4]